MHLASQHWDEHSAQNRRSVRREMNKQKMQLAIKFAYRGDAFRGVQPQSGVHTAGGALLNRLRECAAAQAAASAEEPHAVSFAARTDAGVHAAINLMSCRLRQPVKDLEAFCRAIERHRNDGLAGVCVKTVPFRIVARSSVLSKTYEYKFREQSTEGEAGQGDIWHVAPKLNIEAMQEAGRVLVGEHDFGALRAATCGAKNPRKVIYALHVCEENATTIRLEVHGNGFLRHMVRIIAGTLAEVGCGLRTAESVRAALRSGRRADAGLTAPAHGLTLLHLHVEPRMQPIMTALSLAPAPL